MFEFVRGDEERYQGQGVIYTPFPAPPDKPGILVTFTTRHVDTLVSFLKEGDPDPENLSRFMEESERHERKRLAKDSGYIQMYSVQFSVSREIELFPLEGDIINIGPSTSKHKGKKRLNRAVREYFYLYDTQQEKLTHVDVHREHTNSYMFERFFVPLGRHLAAGDERFYDIAASLERFSAGASYEPWVKDYLAAVQGDDIGMSEACLEMIIAINDENYEKAEEWKTVIAAQR